MRVLVDDRWFGATGIGRFAREIIKRVPAENEIENLSKRWAIKNPISPVLLGLEINRKSPDLFWTPGFMPPMWSKYPYIVTMHDLIHVKFGSKLQAIYYKEVLLRLLREAECILTVSEYSRQDILDWSDFPPEKVISVYNAVSCGYTRAGEKSSPGYQYLLYVGNKRSHKNLRRLIIAFSKASLPDGLKLVFTGYATPELSDLARQLHISDRLVFLGHVTEERLPSVYRGAVAVILVSLYEGFGIPIIEGMACGVPVLASSTSALPEISGGAAHLVDPLNVDEISSGIEAVVYDAALRERLIEQGYKRSQDFSWDETAGKVWKIFASVIS